LSQSAFLTAWVTYMKVEHYMLVILLLLSNYFKSSFIIVIKEMLDIYNSED